MELACEPNNEQKIIKLSSIGLIDILCVAILVHGSFYARSSLIVSMMIARGGVDVWQNETTERTTIENCKHNQRLKKQKFENENDRNESSRCSLPAKGGHLHE